MENLDLYKILSAFNVISQGVDISRINIASCFLPQSNIGLVLHGVMEYDLSLRFLENALTINTKYHGSRSLKVALRCVEMHYSQV